MGVLRKLDRHGDTETAWDADDRQITQHEGNEGHRHDLAQPAEPAHIHFVVHLVLH